MPIDREEVRRIARLAHLEHPRAAGEPTDHLMSDEVLSDLANDLSQILEHVKELETLDTRDVPPTAHGVPLPPLFREDVPGEPRSTDALLAETPERSGDAVCVPRIVE
jgi:aspartyl-tRNA(Asn)/glutamyl-tRNA(Gln) amidotransferase subunit C